MLDALARADANGLRALSASQPGLQDIIELAVTRAVIDWPDAEGVKLLNAVYALKGAGLLDLASGEGARAVRLQLMTACLQVKALAGMDMEAELGLLEIVSESPTKSLAASLMRAWGEAVAADSESAPDERLDKSTGRLAAMAMQLSGLGYDIPALKIRLRGLPQTYVVVAKSLLEAGRGNEVCEQLFVPGVDPSRMAEHLADTADKGRLGEDEVNALRLSGHWAQEGHLESLIAKLKEKLVAIGSIDVGQARHFVTALDALTLSGFKKASSALSALVTEGHAAHWIQAAAAANDFGLAARMLDNWLWFRPELAPPKAVGSSAQGHSLVTRWLSAPPPPLLDALAGIRHEYDEPADMLWTALEKNVALETLVGATLAAYQEKYPSGPWLKPADLVRHAPLLHKHLGLSRVLARHSATDAAGEAMKSEFSAGSAFLYLELCADSGGAFIEWCARGLGGQSRESWRAALLKGNELIRLALRCKERLGSIGLDLGLEFEDALTDLSADIIAGKVTPPDGFRLEELVSLLQPVELESLIERDLYNRYLRRREGDAPALLFEYFGDLLAGSGVLDRDEDKIQEVITPLLRSSNWPALEWLVEQVSDGTVSLGGAKPDQVESLVRRLRKYQSSQGDERGRKVCRELLERVGRPVGDDAETEKAEASAEDED